jgi:hypothetical protein
VAIHDTISNALDDAVAIYDISMLIRSATQALPRIADEELAAQLHSLLKRDDRYKRTGKRA